jgi:hypothetical protein
MAKASVKSMKVLQMPGSKLKRMSWTRPQHLRIDMAFWRFCDITRCQA